MLEAHAELNPKGNNIQVFFPYSTDNTEAIKEVPGRSFKKGTPQRGIPAHWTIPLDITACRRMREEFGMGLTMGPKLEKWARDQVRQERRNKRLITSPDAKLKRVSKEARKWLRGYQRADIAIMAKHSVINANKPGTGKTVEVLMTAVERGWDGPYIIMAPTDNHLDPWVDEIQRQSDLGHIPHTTVFWGEDSHEREEAIYDALHMYDSGDTNFFLIINPEAIRTERYEKDEDPSDRRVVLSKDGKGRKYLAKPEVAGLFQVQWSMKVVDEFHRFGIGEDRDTLFYHALNKLKSERTYLLSGTPMGGKPLRLFGALGLVSDNFTSKWRWANSWLVIEDNGFGKTIGDLRPGREKEFFEAHAQYIVRREREGPGKRYTDVHCEMTPKQAAAYEELYEWGESVLEGGRISAQGMLSEYLRLKQFANALCEMKDGVLIPTMESGKLPRLLAKLESEGIRKRYPEPMARALVGSESQAFVELIEQYLIDNKIPVRRVDGSVKGSERNEARAWYKDMTAGEPRVLVMTIQGGTGLNLGMTGSVHLLDETWNPDDQEQFEDRGMRGRTNELNVYRYRMKGTIQEYIEMVNEGKAITNDNILDVHRRLRARVRDGERDVRAR